MTSSRSSRRLLVAALLGLLRPAAAVALDVKLWPLFRYATGRGDTVRWTALGPLVEFRRTPETRDLYLRPFLWLHQRRGPQHDDRAEVFFPLAASRWQDRFESFRLLLFTYRSSAAPRPAVEGVAPPDDWTSRFSLFPLVFYRHDPETGTRLGVLPFYLDLPDFLGYQRVTAILFPAYLRLDEPRVERRFYGFPFVSTIGGPDGHGFRVWPFYGTKEIAGRERTRYVLWPFHLRSERLVPGWGWDQIRVNFPFFAARDGRGFHSRAYGLVGRTVTRDERAGYEAIGSPWPLVLKERALGDEHWRTWRLAPFYGRSDRQGFSSRFYAWPVYRSHGQEADGYRFERRDVLLLLWRRQEQWNAARARHERLTTLFPALRSLETDDRRSGQVPALADSIMPLNRGVRALWAPLWALVRWDTAPDGRRDWSLLWGLLARERGALTGPVRVSLGENPEVGDGR